jgi:hypothetical protein
VAASLSKTVISRANLLALFYFRASAFARAPARKWREIAGSRSATSIARDGS